MAVYALLMGRFATRLLWAGVLWAGVAHAAGPLRIPVTPIEHLIVVVGENLSFDNLFATYEPPPGESVANLLSRGIVDREGNPGPNFSTAAQHIAATTGRYAVTPKTAGAYATLPQPGTTYATGLPRNQADARFPDDLPNGPFRITRHVPYAAPVGDPVHRFFQMWQQFDGGRHDLVTWVATTSGFDARVRGDPASGTNQGGLGMGFYGMATGDAPYLRKLALTYAIADNYHQPIMGGTGANYLALATGDVGVYLEEGKPAAPAASQIEDPDPLPGSDNWYRNSGAYTRCGDGAAPGVRAIHDYLATLPYRPWNAGNCAPGAYYLINNRSPGYLHDGALRPHGSGGRALPPQSAPNVGTLLAASGVSWKWYSGGRTPTGIDAHRYCSICDPLVHSSAVMTSELRNNLQGLDAFFRDVADARRFPAVSFVVPPNAESGHPAYSTVVAFERFVEEIVSRVQANPALWSKTAILVMTDESGGYYDSGYVQILDFFGDGTRIPMLAVSPFARKGHVDHTYYDHASILKFIERNWRLSPLSSRSRDNLPNPAMTGPDPYVPANPPAIGDLMGLFAF
ncbi:MAG TPA: alkaline phosphatase family protein [Casimicrobiaceae bacterium]|nr:alkaline phosphatase family protein [Casimicrobiaceae bacterium]